MPFQLKNLCWLRSRKPCPESFCDDRSLPAGRPKDEILYLSVSLGKAIQAVQGLLNMASAQSLAGSKGKIFWEGC